MDTSALRKARGAFFTPPELATFVIDWAIRSPSDTVLEPSCGDAAFLLPAACRLVDLGGSSTRLETQLLGVEIHQASADASSARLAEAGFQSSVRIGDFFDQMPRGNFFGRADWPACDVVVGNPPYVRYQQFQGEARAKGLRAALAQGVRLTGLASSWAAFTIHAAHFLQPEGRLGLVLPAELLTVNYAAQVRRFLLNRFASVRLILFEELVFPDVLEEVVVLLAEGSGGTSSFEVHQVRNLADLARREMLPSAGFIPEGGQKWTQALLPADALEIYQNLVDSVGFSSLLDWGETYLGAVTGNNDFFTLTKAQVDELALEAADLLKISPPGSKHLRGLTFSDSAWSHLTRDGKRCYLFSPNPTKPSASALRYINIGEKNAINAAYKCQNRTPWWKVPVVKRPDLFFTYMNHDRPRLTTNDARAHILNSLYGVILNQSGRLIGRELLPIACLNSATLLGAEIVGRSYGGGMLKHEPKEADCLPVPSLDVLEAARGDLRGIEIVVSADLRSTDVTRAVDRVDKVILERHLGLDRHQIAALRRAREFLFHRRIVRARGHRGIT